MYPLQAKLAVVVNIAVRGAGVHVGLCTGRRHIGRDWVHLAALGAPVVALTMFGATQ